MEAILPHDIADPERALAIAYAPGALRPALAALWALDERLGSIVAAASEPMVAAISLAWWREALVALDSGPPPAEPLLRAISRTLLPIGISGAELAEIEVGWAALLTGGPPDEEAIAEHGRARGRPLFGIAARLLAGRAPVEIEQAGEGWALADLARHHRGGDMARARAAECLPAVADYRWPVPLRALGALVKLAHRDALAAVPARQGSPGRIARMLLHRFTGR